MTPVPRKYGERCIEYGIWKLSLRQLLHKRRDFFAHLKLGKLETGGREESFAQGTGNHCARNRTPGSAGRTYESRGKASGQSYSAGASRRGVPCGPAGARVCGFAPAHGAARTTPEIAVGVFSEFGNGV